MHIFTIFHEKQGAPFEDKPDFLVLIFDSFSDKNNMFRPRVAPGTPLEFRKGPPKVIFRGPGGGTEAFSAIQESAETHGGYVKNGLRLNLGRLNSVPGGPRGRPGVNDGPRQVVF